MKFRQPVSNFWLAFSATTVCFLLLVSGSVWAQNPPKQKPIAMGGNCPVASTNDGKLVAGKQQLQAEFGPHKYMLSSQQALEEFIKPNRARQFVPALSGYCPVKIKEEKQFEIGSPGIGYRLDGNMYWFSSEEAREKFKADPFPFLPAFGGDCSYCYVQKKIRKPGSVYSSTFDHNGRLYLFPNGEFLNNFLSMPDYAKYFDMDIVSNDIVAYRESGMKVLGDPKIYTVKQGFVYRFSTAANKTRFEVNPGAYR